MQSHGGHTFFSAPFLTMPRESWGGQFTEKGVAMTHLDMTVGSHASQAPSNNPEDRDG
jgi:hypothetical protein